MPEFMHSFIHSMRSWLINYPPGRHKHVEKAGERVDAVEKDVEAHHERGLHHVELDDVGMEKGPVDDGDPQGDGGEGGLEAPGQLVDGGQADSGAPRGEDAAEHDPGIDDVVQRQEGDSLKRFRMGNLQSWALPVFLNFFTN